MDALEFGGRERIEPAVADLPGYLGTYPMRRADNGFVVLGLGTSVDVFDAAQQRVMSTELLPGEDPTLLRDPDRIDLHRVVYQHQPTPVSS